ncbi:MAG: hypothetical protein WDN06_22280 [Asticcacaulis sp.]
MGDTVVEAANQGHRHGHVRRIVDIGRQCRKPDPDGLRRHQWHRQPASTNIIIGNNGANTLSGSYGNDIIQGGLGNDVIHGGTGIDWLEGGAGNDTIDADDTATIYGDAVNDEITLGAGTGTAYGGDGGRFHQRFGHSHGHHRWRRRRRYHLRRIRRRPAYRR